MGVIPVENTGRTVSRRCWLARAFAAATSTGLQTKPVLTSRTGRSRPTTSAPRSSRPWVSLFRPV